MAKRIMCIGIEIPVLEYHPFGSDQSLLDADIVIFQPNIDYVLTATMSGMPFCPDDDKSRELTANTKRWRHELLVALDGGKTIFVVLNKYIEFYTSRIDKHNNYECLPIHMSEIMPSAGSCIKFLNDPVFSVLWNELEDYCVFETYFTMKSAKPLFTTNAGNKTLGCVVPTVNNGHLIILPQICIPDNFIDSDPDNDYWTADAVRFGKRLTSVVVEIDAALRGDAKDIPVPEWVKGYQYKMASEDELQKDIDSIASQIEALSDKRSSKDNELSDMQSLKLLLYGTGIPLESAVIEALVLLGYHAENYDDGSLEIDQVIFSPEGDRFIGETEGKNNGKVNIDKFRQLFHNVVDDAARDEVEEEATGVLFGNGYRNQEPANREIQFTDKCLKSAEKRSVVLIQTSDLFRVAQYLHDTKDQEFAAECRDAIKNSEGKIVEFPALPSPG